MHARQHTVIALLLATAINLTGYAMDNTNQNIAVYTFLVILAAGVTIAGLFAHGSRVVSRGVTTGGILALIYATLIRYGAFPFLGRAFVEAVALIAIVTAGYWSGIRSFKKGKTPTLLSGLNGFVMGFLVFILSMNLVDNVAGALHETLTTGDASASIVQLTIFVLYLVLGLLLRSLGPISLGFLFAGFLGIIFAAWPYLADQGPLVGALVSIVAVVALILAAYRYFSDHEKDKPRA